MTTQTFETYEEFLEREDKNVNGVSPDFTGVCDDSNVGCWNCTHCTGCIYCDDCAHCKNCLACTGCKGLTGCTIGELNIGNQIDIRLLLPLLKKGWVAMDKSGVWFWYGCKPFKRTSFWEAGGYTKDLSILFNLRPAGNWEDSLMECGL